MDSEKLPLELTLAREKAIRLRTFAQVGYGSSDHASAWAQLAAML
jgi:hypothetical protein